MEERDGQVDFGEERLVYERSQSGGSIARFIVNISRGYIKDESQAYIIMIVIIVTAIIISALLLLTLRTPAPSVIPGTSDLPFGGF
ncbi:MAG: hypothetical protein COU90_00965 [Candidatus Ryanbacteria bacterium CG10_big_fil_rev_8_21_14_0_10_43_42]|uniref:Uncharacterized protein n=1 Tax=Candidatus Ryanbacteria bacterium CG10_big_fil_rev_8_21_14_0_10_43_42 TaxID=1974864 RepID=A0A2M8KY14_9BACT|nr:MAG: hypothetical protein COU90_00965 [Candidatus Ryanbacteria bacterium CG10_big_fil_rev_8_21_14_0_10_43_42]